MRVRCINDSENYHIIVLNNKIFAHAVLYQGNELEIEVYKIGGRKFADEIIVKGGKIPPQYRANDTSLLNILFSLARKYWAGKKVFYDINADPRKSRIYRKILNHYNIMVESDNNYYNEFIIN